MNLVILNTVPTTKKRKQTEVKKPLLLSLQNTHSKIFLLPYSLSFIYKPFSLLKIIKKKQIQITSLEVYGIFLTHCKKTLLAIYSLLSLLKNVKRKT